MRIEDLLIESAETLDATWFQNKEFSCEPSTARYLLYRLAECHFNIPVKFTLQTRPCPSYALLHLVSGTLQYSSPLNPKRVLTLSGDKLILIDCHMSHRLTAMFACEFDVLCFDGYSAPYFCNRLLEECSCFTISSTGELLQKYRFLFQDSCTPILGNLYLTDLLTQIVLWITPVADHIPSYILQIKELFDSDYRRSFTLEELEQQFQVNRYRICKEFKQHLQLSPMQYLHQTRVQAAQNLLRENDMRIHEIADAVGYENVNHFIHQFKKAVGTTPAAYRQTSHTLARSTSLPSIT